jgi:transcriptional regulator with XRE-family HTH domain
MMRFGRPVRVGITQSMLSRIERGQAVPELYDARRFALAFAMRPEEFSKLVEDVFVRTHQIVSQAYRRGDGPWEDVLKLVGAAGLSGVVALAMAALLEDASQ